MEFRKTDAYNKRFTGMAALVKRGQYMTEAEYIAQERAYRATLKSWDLPEGFYDGPEDFGGFIANGVSVKEVDDRVRSAKTFLDTATSSTYRDALRELGVSEGGLIAYLLDADRAQAVIQKEIKTAATMGAGRKYGFALDSAQGARYGAVLGDEYNALGVDQRNQLEEMYGKLGRKAENDERLAFIDKDTSFDTADILDAELLGDNEKKTASERRSLREKGRFSGSGGFGSASIQSGGI